MPDQKLFIPIILGTNREGRNSKHVANFLLSKLKNHPEITTQLFDARDFNFPTDDYGQSIKSNFPEFTSTIEKSDGIILIIPEYNHGYPGILKSMLDMLYSEFKHKSAGLVGVSTGPMGGSRAVENLIPVLRELRLVISGNSLHFPSAQTLFDKSGQILETKYNERTDSFFKELIWLSRVLKWGRQNLG